MGLAQLNIKKLNSQSPTFLNSLNLNMCDVVECMLYYTKKTLLLGTSLQIVEPLAFRSPSFKSTLSAYLASSVLVYLMQCFQRCEISYLNERRIFLKLGKGKRFAGCRLVVVLLLQRNISHITHSALSQTTDSKKLFHNKLY